LSTSVRRTATLGSDAVAAVVLLVFALLLTDDTRADMSLHETLGDTLKALALKAHEKGIELLSDIEPTLPDKLIGDPVRLRQVIINLGTPRRSCSLSFFLASCYCSFMV
jgi:signal transduction histidine kinase